MLRAQTYKKFKVFITGDNYQPESEFMEVCNSYWTYGSKRRRL